MQCLNTLHSLVCNNLTSRTKVFADDCAIFCQVSNAADCDVLQEDLATVYTWAQRWQLPLNLSKCKVVCISNKRRPCPHIYLPCEQVMLEWVDSFRVRINSKLKWDEHIADITGKANQVLNLLRQTMYGCSKNAKTRPLLGCTWNTMFLRGTHISIKIVRPLKKSN